eukprot:3888616-Rhodomonas_salina.2
MGGRVRAASLQRGGGSPFLAAYSSTYAVGPYGSWLSDTARQLVAMRQLGLARAANGYGPLHAEL